MTHTIQGLNMKGKNKDKNNTLGLEMPKLIKVARTQCDNSENLEEIAKKAVNLYSNFQSVEGKFRAVRPISRLFGGKVRYADSGACAFVYKLDIDGRKYALKIAKKPGSVSLREYEHLEALSDSGVTPKPVACFALDDGKKGTRRHGILMEYIEGKTLFKYIVEQKIIGRGVGDISSSLEAVFKQFERKEMLLPDDAHSANIIVRGKNNNSLDIAMVDLESADSYDKYNSTAEASRMNRWRLENLMSKICFVEASKLSALLPIYVRMKF